MFLDVDALTLTIHPVDSSLVGKSYAVYITGHPNVNATMQGPMFTSNLFNEISVPVPFVSIKNEAPRIQNFVKD